MSDKCAVYARVSTEKQEDSVMHQVSLLREYIRIKNLGELPDEFIYEDVAVSATKMTIWTRPAMKRLLTDAEAGKFNIIVFKGISRLARNTHEALDVLERLKTRGLRVISYEENYDSEKENSNFMFTMHAAVAEYEAEKLAIRVRLGLKEVAKKGQPVGKIPYGYVRVNGTFLVVPEEAKIVKEIFRLYLDENLGTYLIAQKLNELGSYTRYGKLWHPRTVLGIIKNPTYTGAVVFNKTQKSDKVTYRTRNSKEEWETCEDAHEAIISKEIFQKANAKITRNALHNNKGSRAAKYPLTGVLVCGHCGSTMGCSKKTTKTKNKIYEYRHYGCHNRIQMGLKYCSQEMIEADAIEDVIIEKLGVILKDLKKRVEAGEGIEEIKGGAEELKKELKNIDKKMEKTNNDTANLYFEREEMTEVQYRHVSKKLKERMNALTAERDDLLMRIELSEQEEEQLHEIKNYIDEFFTVDKSEGRRLRKLIMYFIEKIVVTDTNIDIHYKVKID